MSGVPSVHCSRACYTALSSANRTRFEVSHGRTHQDIVCLGGMALSTRGSRRVSPSSTADIKVDMPRHGFRSTLPAVHRSDDPLRVYVAVGLAVRVGFVGLCVFPAEDACSMVTMVRRTENMYCCVGRSLTSRVHVHDHHNGVVLARKPLDPSTNTKGIMPGG